MYEVYLEEKKRRKKKRSKCGLRRELKRKLICRSAGVAYQRGIFNGKCPEKDVMGFLVTPAPPACRLPALQGRIDVSQAGRVSRAALWYVD